MLKTICDLRERKGLERTEGFIERTVLTAVVCVSGEQSSQLVWLRSKKEDTTALAVGEHEKNALFSLAKFSL